MAGLPSLLRIRQLWRRAGKKESEATPAAQHLPSRIIQRIALYISAVDGYRGASSDDDRITRAVGPLSRVCRSWRVSVLTLFYQHFVLDINCTAMWITRTRQMVYTKSEYISDNVRHLAKRVYLTAPFAGIFSGKVVDILNENHFKQAVFPGVTVLRLNFYCGTIFTLQEVADYKTHVEAFCAYVHALFPNAQEYYFRVSSFTDTDDSNMVGFLLSRIIRDGCRVAEYTHSSGGVLISGLLNVSGLTHLCIEDQACMEDCVELMRRNASTLVSVDLGVVDVPDILPQLVTDDDGNAIVYPQLHRLAIHMSLLPKDMVAVFPALQDLQCTTGSLRIANTDPVDII
ncbi:hypothetical protein H4R26_000469 [Coemansia thaxteri]|uniref:F-box domain-containing protein n=1 Tax=Coemansia thaxteri TaxID=2663907 RepID=A0A9W8EM27_9FUNG|nr:hypothetical protein H4R26_000469 [Coemansia thaxteri]KAJ2484853.1 hypothetical protein EV174_002118 [Coemansia sp. RSA 2320]